MSGEITVAIVALFVAIAGIVVAVFATRRWGNRRGKLDLTFRSIPLIPEGVRPGLLQLSFRDFVVENPHLVEISLVNVGPRDIASAFFDGGRPISIAFNQTFYGLTGVEGGAALFSPALGADAPDAIVRITPLLLKRGESWNFTAVLAGVPEIDVDCPLIDTDLRLLKAGGAGEAEVNVRVSFLGLSAELLHMPLRRERQH
ncbi:MAG TPA: hypothetical protein VGC18_13775 [Lacisediminihabitans sp.]|uniref:hypothetical protein n=1 Tax=Lacisediminihabitans sp. TaxID=2787631 RepID=UPI002EDB0EFB